MAVQEESEMIAYGKHCEVCYSTKREDLFPCGRCHMVNYCSLDHQEADDAHHAAECQTLAFSLLCMAVIRVGTHSSSQPSVTHLIYL